MTSSLSPRERRTVVLGGGAILLVLLLFKVFPAWRRWDEGVRASAAELVAEAASSEAGVRTLSAAVDSAEARQARLAWLGPLVLDGESPAAAGAALAGLVSAAATGAGVHLSAVQVRSDAVRASTFVRVSVRADATGDLGGVTRMLEALERGPELLAVREIALTQPDAGGASDRPESLRLEVVVEGLALVTPRSASSDTGSDGDRTDDSVDPASSDVPAFDASEEDASGKTASSGESSESSDPEDEGRPEGQLPDDRQTR
jgi:type II secretory pathway component PulM